MFSFATVFVTVAQRCLSEITEPFKPFKVRLQKWSERFCHNIHLCCYDGVEFQAGFAKLSSNQSAVAFNLGL